MSKFECGKIVFPLILGAFSITSNAATTEPDWQARFLSQAPKEWSAFDAAIGQMEGIVDESYASRDRSSASTTRGASTRNESPLGPAIHRQIKFYFNSTVAGIKLVSTRVPDNGKQSVLASNGNYDFELAKNDPDQKLYISKYSPGDTANAQDSTSAESEFLHYILAPVTLGAARLKDLVNGDAGVLRSVEPVTIDGKQLVRLNFDRKFNYTHKLYSGWALIDPDMHWAIVQYEQQDEALVYSATIDYQPDVVQVAFPKRIVQDEKDLTGGLVARTILDFSKPQPCSAQPKDFTLEAYGLEPPKSGVPSPDVIPKPVQTNAAGTADSSSNPNASAPVMIANDSSWPFISVFLAICAASLGLIFFGLFVRGRLQVRKRP
jgi:hypothetical protein